MNDAIKLSDILSKQDLAVLRSKSNIHAASIVLLNWAMIIVAILLFAFWPNPLSFIFSVLLLAGRQLGLGVLLHECAHNSLFETKKLNEFVGQYVCGAIINVPLFAYRDYHLDHHKYAGTEQDPDAVFVEKYPVHKASLKRKLIRDITGQTGIRDTSNKLKSLFVSKDIFGKSNWDKGKSWLVAHAAMFLCLFLLGVWWAYSIWWVAELFVLPVLYRLRQIGEHGVATDRSVRSPRMNTGTTIVSWWERLFIAPNYVNYHVEHHQFASVPCYRLPLLHSKLNDGGYFDGYDCIAYGYADVLKRAVV